VSDGVFGCAGSHILRRESSSSERREKQKRTTLSSSLRSTGHFFENLAVVPPQKGEDGDDVYQQTEH